VEIDCVIPTKDNVYPMIPSGQSVKEMMMRHDLEQVKASVHADAETWSFSDEEKVLEQFAEVVAHSSDSSD
jgi:uncharacterized protein YajQ (UPF0234 family)